MKNRFLKHSVLIVTVLLIAGMLISCAPAVNTPTPNPTTGATPTPAPLTPITFKVLDPNGEKVWGNDLVSKEITRLTGVTLEYIPIGNNGDEKASLLLASGDIPDLLGPSLFGVTEKNYIAAGAVLPLDALIDKVGSNIKSKYGKALDLMRALDGGKLYKISSWLQKPFANFPNECVMMRQDIVREFAPAKADGDGYFTFTEYLDLLRQVKAKYPDMIPFLGYGEAMEWTSIWPMRGFLGIAEYSIQGDQVKLFYQDPKLVEAYKMMNTITREGLTDPEWLVMKYDPWVSACSSGKVFSSVGSYWGQTAASTTLAKTDPKKVFMVYKLAGDGVDPNQVRSGGIPALGWNAVMVGKNCADPERAVAFLDFCVSDAGHNLIYFGVEGTNYDMVGGKPVPKQNLIDAVKAGTYSTDMQPAIGTGIWNLAIIDTRGTKDGTFSLEDYVSFQSGGDPLGKFADKSLAGTAYDSTIYQGLEPASGTPEALIVQKCWDIFVQSAPGIFNAASPAEVETLFAKMQSDLDAAGVAKVDAILTANYAARKAIFAANPIN